MQLLTLLFEKLPLNYVNALNLKEFEIGKNKISIFVNPVFISITKYEDPKTGKPVKNKSIINISLDTDKSVNEYINTYYPFLHTYTDYVINEIEADTSREFSNIYDITRNAPLCVKNAMLEDKLINNFFVYLSFFDISISNRYLQDNTGDFVCQKQCFCSHKSNTLGISINKCFENDDLFSVEYTRLGNTEKLKARDKSELEKYISKIARPKVRQNINKFIDYFIFSKIKQIAKKVYLYHLDLKDLTELRYTLDKIGIEYGFGDILPSNLSEFDFVFTYKDEDVSGFIHKNKIVYVARKERNTLYSFDIKSVEDAITKDNVKSRISIKDTIIDLDLNEVVAGGEKIPELSQSSVEALFVIAINKIEYNRLPVKYQSLIMNNKLYDLLF